MTRLDWLFLIVTGLGVASGLGYITLQWGWVNAMGAASLVCLVVGVLGGMRE